LVKIAATVALSVALVGSAYTFTHKESVSTTSTDSVQHSVINRRMFGGGRAADEGHGRGLLTRRLAGSSGVVEKISKAIGTAATKVGSAMSDAGLAGPVAADLNDAELLVLLAQAAKAVYKFDIDGIDQPGIELTTPGAEISADTKTAWAMYTITRGRHEGKTILSFRGTHNIEGVRQYLNIIGNGPLIKAAAWEAERIARKYMPDFVTGHSLGGFLAEVTCSRTGVPGASFAAPGPVGQISHGLTGDKYGGVKWKTVINRNDIVITTVGGIGGSQSSHIVKSSNILWLDWRGDLSACHDMQTYLNQVTKLSR